MWQTEDCLNEMFNARHHVNPSTPLIVYWPHRNNRNYGSSPARVCPAKTHSTQPSSSVVDDTLDDEYGLVLSFIVDKIRSYEHNILNLDDSPTTPMPFLTRRINSLVASTSSRAWQRSYASLVPKSRKVYDSAEEAVKDVKSGDILLSGGESRG
jgi:hypothetical protein